MTYIIAEVEAIDLDLGDVVVLLLIIVAGLGACLFLFWRLFRRRRSLPTNDHHRDELFGRAPTRYLQDTQQTEDRKTVEPACTLWTGDKERDLGAAGLARGARIFRSFLWITVLVGAISTLLAGLVGAYALMSGGPWTHDAARVASCVVIVVVYALSAYAGWIGSHGLLRRCYLVGYEIQERRFARAGFALLGNVLVWFLIAGIVGTIGTRDILVFLAALLFTFPLFAGCLVNLKPGLVRMSLALPARAGEAKCLSSLAALLKLNVRVFSWMSIATYATLSLMSLWAMLCWVVPAVQPRVIFPEHHGTIDPSMMRTFALFLVSGVFSGIQAVLAYFSAIFADYIASFGTSSVHVNIEEKSPETPI